MVTGASGLLGRSLLQSLAQRPLIEPQGVAFQGQGHRSPSSTLPIAMKWRSSSAYGGLMLWCI